ncbi:hypothetical protein TNIN_84321 [Trichonephila inaurata madagascariensis]|uniref:Uncharacterized protein n=1 Tax=Trichonephila inaurata madagascariensis TaxID=2747483 RepID=A0A8X6XAK6_9ARAC|nr:hypothetical protein TNIN_62001 [Trichonephila inaurata madagascariensis]GFY51844.1 hypothetical protein TNIN_84321 [Trichonephila inaurata madagascariensis]
MSELPGRTKIPGMPQILGFQGSLSTVKNNMEKRQLHEIPGVPQIPGMAETSRMNQILSIPPIPEESDKEKRQLSEITGMPAMPELHGMP